MKKQEKKQESDNDVPSGNPQVGPETSTATDSTDNCQEPAGVAAGEISGQPIVESVPADQQLSDHDNRYLRLMADFDNFRKRTVRERVELYQRANEDIIEEILPVLDHLDLAVKSAEKHNVEVAVLDGFRLVAEQLLSALRKSGLTPIDSDGQQFDPGQHEAIAHLPSDTVPENKVMTQVRRGYMLGGKMLRAAQVVVSSGKPHQVSGMDGQPQVSNEGE